MFLNKNDNDLLGECGILKNNLTCLCKEYENILLEQKEEYLE